MRFSINAAPFLGAVSAAGRTCGAAGKNKSPILSHLLIRADRNGAAVTGTNMIAAITTSIEVEPDEPGAVALPADRLHQLLSSAPSGAAVTVEGDEAGATLRYGRSRYRLPALPAEDFPELLSPAADAVKWEMSAGDVAALRSVNAAASDELQRQYLCGTCVQSAGGKLVMVACDGHTLITTTTEIQLDAPWLPWPPSGFIIPRSAVTHIASLGKHGCALRCDGKKVELTADRTTFVSCLVDATYVAWRQVLPNPGPNSVIVGSEEFAAALRRAEVVGIEHKLGVTVNVSWDSAHELRMKIPQTERGECEDAIAADVSGAGDVCFSIAKMLALIDALDGDHVCLDYDGKGAAILTTVPGRASTAAVLMACRY